ncbi:serine hydrolase domain-containing protein [Sphingosinicella terrae]|uniref:serine hydrolase domain-containing protein n=1 Tax=Sphingosinicella terrae TaxID=2172047 RepID=UPI000E0CF468|nr:serine hydrolase domain-containing protein [Sphingosinicella terrae]
MTFPIDRRSFLTHAAAGVAAGMAGHGELRAQSGAGPSDLLDAEREVIRAGMADDDIGAVAVCLVDRAEPVWLEGFGRTSGGDGGPVTPDTLFSIQSTSKSLTAVAVLLAVQEGLLDLDVPITRYLPDFSVNSRFEQAPQDRITLRLLLANRAGFTHEAPVGNNYEPASPSFEAHVRSISRTWLRFPVGDRYRYSNLGYDLAGYIVGHQSGLGYAEWLRRKLLAPLGMTNSTADPAIYASAADRASGSHRGYPHVPLVTPLVASGGIWTTARDMAAYAAFLAARGAWQGQQILAGELWSEMHGFGFGGDYGLGVMRSERRHGTTPVRLLHHRGGGFGFGCNLVYCPEVGLGWVALFSRPALSGYRFGNGLIDRLLSSRFGPRAPRLPSAALAAIRPLESQARALAGRYVGRNLRAEIRAADGQLHLRRDGEETAAALGMTAPDALFTIDDEGETVTYRHHPATDLLPAHLECSEGESSLDFNDGPGEPPGPDKSAWERYVGRYRIDQWGRSAMELVVERRRGHLYLDGVRLIVETEPGLFFTSDGEAVDFRSSPPTWRNLRLRRV